MKQDIRLHACDMLEQLEETIGLFQFQPEYYARPLAILHGNSMGKHVRHIVEFFQCLDLAVGVGLVDYDQRKRNLRLEEDPLFGVEVIQQLKMAISDYSEQALRLRVDYGNGTCEVATTLFRELVYNIEHTVHHLAIIKIGINTHFPDLEISQSLGVAYSTQQHQKAS